MSNKNQHKLVFKDQYSINPERYHELRHFCLQYPIWIDAYVHLDGLSQLPPEEMERLNPTCSVGVVRARYKKWIDLVDNAARAAAPKNLLIFLRMSVTEGKSFKEIEQKFGGISCDEATFRNYKHQFFYILSEMRE